MKPRSPRKTGRKWHEAPSISFEGGKSYLRPPAARKLPPAAARSDVIYSTTLALSFL